LVLDKERDGAGRRKWFTNFSVRRRKWFTNFSVRRRKWFTNFSVSELELVLKGTQKEHKRKRCTMQGWSVSLLCLSLTRVDTQERARTHTYREKERTI
jgi:hypothetical protein